MKNQNFSGKFPSFKNGNFLDLDLKYLKKDKFGLYPNIEEEVFEEIRLYQNYFEPIFLKLLPKYMDSEELADIDRNRPFCFSPRTLKVISDKVIIPIAEELKRNLGDVYTDVRKEYSWKEAHISSILGKLLAFESFRMSRIMATRAREHMEKHFYNENSIRVLEYCTGSGINTAILYFSLDRISKDIHFHTVDNAIQSVACSAGFLSSIGIPIRIVLDATYEDSEFKGVTIYFDTVEHFSEKKQKLKYHLIVSDSGLNYLPEYTAILAKSPDFLLEKGLIHICTLDPKVDADLSIFKMLATIAFGNHPEIYKKHKDNIYSVEKKYRRKEDGIKEEIVSIKQVFSASSSLQYNILQVLFKEDRNLFWDYLNGARAAATLIKILSPRVRIDLRESGKTLERLYPDAELQYIPTYERQEVSLTRILELDTALQRYK